jgi:hypothetical protein
MQIAVSENSCVEMADLLGRELTGQGLSRPKHLQNLILISDRPIPHRPERTHCNHVAAYKTVGKHV